MCWGCTDNAKVNKQALLEHYKNQRAKQATTKKKKGSSNIEEQTELTRKDIWEIDQIPWDDPMTIRMNIAIAYKNRILKSWYPGLNY